MTKPDKAAENLRMWNRLEISDKSYLKRFDRGSFKGVSVDPAYNMKRLTGELGPVGFAWGWEVKSERTNAYGEGHEQQVIHTAVVRAWFRQPDGGKEHVEHIGQTKAAYWSRAKPGQPPRFVVDEEAAKKSVTDALSKIMMALGASADIWLGRFDGNKYVAPAPEVVDGDTAETGHVRQPELPRQLAAPPHQFREARDLARLARA